MGKMISRPHSSLMSLSVQSFQERKDHSPIEDMATCRMAMLTVHTWCDSNGMQRLIKKDMSWEEDVLKGTEDLEELKG